MSVFESYNPTIRRAIVAYARAISSGKTHSEAWYAAYTAATAVGIDDFHAEYIATLARFEAGARQ